MYKVSERHLPVICPKCGGTDIVRIIWRCVHLSGNDKGDVEAGRAILACPQRGEIQIGAPLGIYMADTSALPLWACISCVPDWIEVHHLALQDYQWQLEKEVALAKHDFDYAVKLQKQQHDNEEILFALLEKIIGPSEWGTKEKKRERRRAWDS